MKKLVILLLTAVCAVGLVYGEMRATATADSVNMRARANTQVETVKPQLNEGDVVTVRNVDGEWAEIVPPGKTDLYVYSAFVEDGVIQVSKLRVRSGPSINHKPVGMVNKGDEVEVRGRFGEWLKIAPPPGSSLWVSTKFLKGLNGGEKTVKKKEPTPPEKEEAESVRDRRTVSDPDREAPQKRSDETSGEDRRERRTYRPTIRSVRHKTEKTSRKNLWESSDRSEEEQEEYIPSDLDLIPLKGQGDMEEKEGKLRRSDFRLFSTPPADYRLVVPRGNGFVTVCYVKGNIQQLKNFKGDRLKVKGDIYWVRGEDVPVVVPSRIIPR